MMLGIVTALGAVLSGWARTRRAVIQTEAQNPSAQSQQIR